MNNYSNLGPDEEILKTSSVYGLSTGDSLSGSTWGSGSGSSGGDYDPDTSASPSCYQEQEYEQ